LVGDGAEAGVSVPLPVLDLQVYELTENTLILNPVCFQMQLHCNGTSVPPQVSFQGRIILLIS